MAEQTLVVSTHKKKGDIAVRTWISRFDNAAEIRVDERIGPRTRTAGVYVKPKHGDLVFFGWVRNALGAPNPEGKIFYAAAVATLRALAAQRPDTEVLYGPMMRTGHLIGASIAAAIVVYLAIPPAGEAISWPTVAIAGLIVLLSALSVLRSGIFAKRRTMRVSEAADLLARHGAEL